MDDSNQIRGQIRGKQGTVSQIITCYFFLGIDEPVYQIQGTGREVLMIGDLMCKGSKAMEGVAVCQVELPNKTLKLTAQPKNGHIKPSWNTEFFPKVFG